MKTTELTIDFVREQIEKLFPRLAKETPAFMDGLAERTLSALMFRDMEALYHLCCNLRGLQDHRLKLISEEQAIVLLDAIMNYHSGRPFIISDFPDDQEIK